MSMAVLNDNPTDIITGTHINYYHVCKRKLWLFSHGISMEHTSDTVLLGKLIDESSYERKDKQIDIDGSIVIDWIELPADRMNEAKGILHEVKKTDKMEAAHRWQVLYYLWYLEQKGVTGLKGEIDYPKLKQKTEVILGDAERAELASIVRTIRDIVSRGEIPEKAHKRLCKSCSYLDLCWA